MDSAICCWLAHHMRCVLITALGILVEPEVNRNLVIVSGAGGGHGGIHRGRGFGGQQRREGRGGAAGHGAFGRHQFHVGCHRGQHGAAVAVRVGREHQARREGLHHMVQLVEVLAHQRVGGRRGAIGNAGVHAAQPQQGVFKVVLAQDQHRALGRQAPVQQPLADAARGVERLRERDMAPVARGAVGVPRAAREQRLPGARLRPVHQPVGDAAWERRTGPAAHSGNARRCRRRAAWRG